MLSSNFVNQNFEERIKNFLERFSEGKKHIIKNLIEMKTIRKEKLLKELRKVEREIEILEKMLEEIEGKT